MIYMEVKIWQQGQEGKWKYTVKALRLYVKLNKIIWRQNVIKSYINPRKTTKKKKQKDKAHKPMVQIKWNIQLIHKKLRKKDKKEKQLWQTKYKYKDSKWNATILIGILNVSNLNTWL